MRNTEGELDPWLSLWFSYELTRKDWPWIYERGNRPSLIISTLEALAVLVSLKLFFGDEPKKGRTKVQVVPTWTGNRGNGSALNKLMSTKCPSSAVVMELSCYLKRMSAKASVEWAPRTANYEADSLANGETNGFDPSRRIEVDVNTLRWEILPDALRMGRQMEEDTKVTRAIGISTSRGKKLGRRRQEDKMKVKDPWGGTAQRARPTILESVVSFHKLHPWSDSHWSYILPVQLWRLQTGLLAGRPREFSGSVNRSAVSRGEKSVGGNPDTEVSGWENPGSGELQNSVSYTCWDDQEFSVVNREVNFFVRYPFRNKGCSLDYPGIQQPSEQLCSLAGRIRNSVAWHGERGGEGGGGVVKILIR